jgi:hypothetical protein
MQLRLLIILLDTSRHLVTGPQPMRVNQLSFHPERSGFDDGAQPELGPQSTEL